MTENAIDESKCPWWIKAYHIFSFIICSDSLFYDHIIHCSSSFLVMFRLGLWLKIIFIAISIVSWSWILVKRLVIS